MNKVQRNYMMAKAELQTCEELARDIERAYIAKNKIRNEDGEIPARVYCIDNEAVFNKANEETARIIKENGLEEKINSALENLRAAEENLLKFALSIAPAGIRKTLERGARENYTTRMKLIDYTLRLDVSTV